MRVTKKDLLKIIKEELLQLNESDEWQGQQLEQSPASVPRGQPAASNYYTSDDISQDIINIAQNSIKTTSMLTDGRADSTMAMHGLPIRVDVQVNCEENQATLVEITLLTPELALNKKGKVGPLRRAGLVDNPMKWPVRWGTDEGAVAQATTVSYTHQTLPTTHYV